MESGIPSNSFWYTAAPFGHDGINGFQFVGLPEGGAAPELIEAVAEHVRYSAPLGVPSQPTAEEIANSFPVSTRIVAGAPGRQCILVKSRYIGQVYQSDGRRGKWGNFFAHARVVPNGLGTTATLINIVRTAEWRDRLEIEELAAARPINLPVESLASVNTLGSDQIDERDRAAGLAAILARLDGDLPLLLPDTAPERALAIFQDLAANLPETLACRLSWSSFEFDAGPGYDILATIGDTRLSADADAYLRLDAPPNNPIYQWAGEQICSDGAIFWERLSLFSDLSEANRLADALSLARQIQDARPSELEPVFQALALVRKGPADPKRIEAVEAIFVGSFGVLGDGEKDNFELLVEAAKEAQALSKWSGSDRPWKELVRWAEAFPSIQATLVPVGSSEPLTKAMRRAILAGIDLDHLIDMTMAAVERDLTLGSNKKALSTAILSVLPDGGKSEEAARTILRLASHHLKSVGHSALVQDILKMSGRTAGLDWLNLVMAKLPTVAPDLAAHVLPDLELGILENLADETNNIGELSQRISKLAVSKSDKSRNERLESLLERLDTSLPDSGRKQENTAASLIKAATAHGINLEAAPNALALQAAGSGKLMKSVLGDANLFIPVQRKTASRVYITFFDSALGALKPETLQGSAKNLKLLWREDVRDHFVKYISRYFQNRSKGSVLVEILDDAVMAHSRTDIIDQREDDWASICKTVAFSLAPKLDQRSFDELVRDFPRSSLVDEMARRRKRGIKGVGRSVSKVLRGLSPWRKGD